MAYLDKFKLLQILRGVIESEADAIVDKLMDRFDKEILPYEDPDDPARPSLCKDEFKAFLKQTFENQLKVVNNFVEIGVCDDEKLGFGEELDPETTDCVKIIGTIIQGIAGDYVLVTSQMTGEPEGRFGRAFIISVDEYKKEAVSKGWDPDKPIWRFSNFKGVPDFFSNLDLKEVVKRINRKFGEAIKSAWKN
jgi:hypothetical protein